MSTSQEQLNSKVQRATARLVQLQARQALHDMRRQAQQRARSRKRDAFRKQELGEAVLQAGLGDWSPAEITGLLQRAKQHFGANETTRKLLAQGPSAGTGAPGSTSVH